jgi:hypothetical protein
MVDQNVIEAALSNHEVEKGIQRIHDFNDRFAPIDHPFGYTLFEKIFNIFLNILVTVLLTAPFWGVPLLSYLSD